MTAFDKREEGFERAFALDEEKHFKAIARRNRYLGLWAAERLGMDSVAADAYARGLVERLVGETDDGALTRELTQALASVSPELSAHRLQRKIEELTARATTEIAEGR